MTPEALCATLADLGMSDEAFASFVGEDVALVRGWVSGSAAIPVWLPSSMVLLSAFVSGVRRGGVVDKDFGPLLSRLKAQSRHAPKGRHRLH